MLLRPNNRRYTIVNYIINSLVIASLVYEVACVEPPARLSVADGVATIDVQTLGEYPTTIRRARLENKVDKSTVWEIEAAHGTPQLRAISLRVGVNSTELASPYSGTYSVVVPNDSATFRLDRGTIYILELWEDPASLPRKVEIQFGT